MVADLAERHGLVSDMFALPQSADDWRKYRLTAEQVAFYHEQGYLAGVRVLSDAQVDRLREELHALTDPSHPANSLFYEYNSNESVDRSKVLFHALGAWRITPGFHDILWNPAFTVPASQLLGGAVRFWRPASDAGRQSAGDHFGSLMNFGYFSLPSAIFFGQTVTCLPSCHWKTSPLTASGP